jgi:nicotinamidase-related amidase
MPRSPGCQLATALDVAGADGVIVKKRYSGFFGTGLDDRLRAAEATTLVLAGVNTHACVRMTAIDAYQRDYDVVLAGDCIGS